METAQKLSYDMFAHKRAEMQAEQNKRPFAFKGSKIWEKLPHEKTLVKTAKANYKVFKKNVIKANEEKNSILKQMLECETPKWGSIKLGLSK